MQGVQGEGNDAHTHEPLLEHIRNSLMENRLRHRARGVRMFIETSPKVFLLTPAGMWHSALQKLKTMGTVLSMPQSTEWGFHHFIKRKAVWQTHPGFFLLHVPLVLVLLIELLFYIFLSTLFHCSLLFLPIPPFHFSSTNFCFHTISACAQTIPLICFFTSQSPILRSVCKQRSASVTMEFSTGRIFSNSRNQLKYSYNDI